MKLHMCSYVTVAMYNYDIAYHSFLGNYSLAQSFVSLNEHCTVEVGRKQRSFQKNANCKELIRRRFADANDFSS